MEDDQFQSWYDCYLEVHVNTFVIRLDLLKPSRSARARNLLSSPCYYRLNLLQVPSFLVTLFRFSSFD
jgi:hypothetical protein